MNSIQEKISLDIPAVNQNIPSPFDSLPKELFPIILSNMNYLDLPGVACLNKAWNIKTIISAKENQTAVIDLFANEIFEPIKTLKFYDHVNAVTQLTLKQIKEQTTLQQINLETLAFYKTVSEDFEIFFKDFNEKNKTFFLNPDKDSPSPEFQKFHMQFTTIHESIETINNKLVSMSNSLVEYGYYDRASSVVKLLSSPSINSFYQNIIDKLFQKNNLKLLQVINEIITEKPTLQRQWALRGIKDTLLQEISVKFVDCDKLTLAINFLNAKLNFINISEMVKTCLPSLQRGHSNQLIDYINTQHDSEKLLSEIFKKLVETDHYDLGLNFAKAIFDEEIKGNSLKDASITLMRKRCFDQAVEFALLTPSIFYKTVESKNLLLVANLCLKLAKTGIVKNIEKANEIANLIPDENTRNFALSGLSALSKT